MRHVLVNPDITASETSIPFHQKMVDAMSMSFFKYGAVAAAYPSQVDAIASLKLRLQKYEETGNTEYLVDCGNFAMIEFMHPRHPDAHYKPEDSGNSPGRVWHNGLVTETANTTSVENIRLGGTAMKTSGGFYTREGD